MSTLTESKLPCPKCPSSDAFHRYDDGHGYCFSCQYYQPPNNRFEDLSYTYEYIPHRGLNHRTLEFYDIKTKIDEEGKPISVGFKYPNGSYKVRSLEQKEFRWEGPSEAGLYGRNLFTSGESNYVVICEGEYDAASLFQTLHCPVVSVRSSASAVADVSHDRSWIAGFGKVYLAFDSDSAGREATRNVAKLFDYNKILVLDFDRRKDANEYLQANEADILKNIWKNAKRYLPETIVSSFSDFRKILSETPKVGQPYPFPKLNELTYGIRKGESVLLTAQEGVGKSTIMHAILHKLLKETDDGIGAIFLEEPKGHLLRSLAGVELQRPTHLPECGVTEAEITSAIEILCKHDDRLHLYSHFGSGDPDEILDSIRFMVAARSCGYVFLDHISMVVSGLAGEDERRALDYIATRLEMMVKELNFALLMVSHVNDNGQTRGSRYIGKVSDIRIDATRNLLEPDEHNRNKTLLSVSKNRYCGRTGLSGSYFFDAYRRQYTEVGATNDNEEGVQQSAA